MEKESIKISQLIEQQIKSSDFEIRELINKISFHEFINMASFYIGYENARLKYCEGSTIKRQSYIASLGGFALDYLIHLYSLDSIYNVELNNIDVKSITNFDIINELFNKAVNIDNIKTSINYYSCDNWEYERISDNHYRQIIPEKSKSIFNQSYKANIKSNCLINYHKNFVDDSFSIKTHSFPDYKQTFSGYSSSVLSLKIDKSNIKELLTSGFYCRYLSELSSFLVYLPFEDSDKEFKLKFPNKEYNIGNLIKIYTLISEISRLHINRIYDEFNQKLDFVFTENENQNLEIKELKDIYLVHRNQLNSSNYLIIFDKAILTDLIVFALDIPKRDVELALELLKFDINNSKSNYSFQPFINNITQIYWLPYSFGYPSVSQLLFEAILSKEGEKFSNIQTKLIEKYYNALFKEKGFKICELDSDRTIKALGDFDILAYKDGSIINIEIKLSGVKNEINQIYNWKKSRLEIKAAMEQLPKLRKYIEHNKPDILKRLGLSENTKIDNINSFIASNSFLLDNEIFNGFQKISLFELVVLLTDTEIFMYDFIDYLKRSILFIKEHTDRPIPVKYLKWAQNEISLDYEKDIETFRLMDRYIKNFLPKLWFDNANPSIEELVNHIKNKRLFGHLDTLKYPEIKFICLTINNIKIEIPSIEAY